ncbi:hypothetical protein KUCAC02_037807, partial [Chaenocephalus aceratus]
GADGVGCRRNKQEVTEAACELICDWAQKILKRSFDTTVEIARYLIQEHIVNPRFIKKTVISKADGEGAADHKKDFGDSSSSSSSLRPGDKSAAAVEAFMKQLPRILPRSSLPDKTHLSVSSSPSLLAPPPSLAPKDLPGVGGASAPGGQVKVISMGGGALPVMILPQSKPRGQGSGVTKRPPSDPFPAPLPLKRKRGRPRKPRPEEAPPPLPPAVLSPKPPPPSHMPIITSVTGGVIQLLQSAPPPHWEIQGVIQKAPRPGNNMLAVPSAVLPPPTLHDDDQVEITLTPVELHLDTPTSYSSAPTSCSPLTKEVRNDPPPPPIFFFVGGRRGYATLFVFSAKPPPGVFFFVGASNRISLFHINTRTSMCVGKRLPEVQKLGLKTGNSRSPVRPSLDLSLGRTGPSGRRESKAGRAQLLGFSHWELWFWEYFTVEPRGSKTQT